MPSPFDGLALHYLILDGASRGSPDRVTEVAFGQPPVQGGLSIAYGNLLDQREDDDGNPIRECGPYLDAKGTAAQYGEGVPDPDGPGFDRNFRLQCELAKQQGHTHIEGDNPDDPHFNVDVVRRALDLAKSCGLRNIAKNPGLLNGGAAVYVAHHTVDGIIIEHGAGGAADNDEIRRQAGKPDLPMWFVYFGSKGRARADRCAAEIQSLKLKNASVSLSTEGEYGNAVDILLPTPAAASTQTPSSPMAYSLTWLPDVLRAAGLEVEEVPGWQSRGHREFGKPLGVLCHNTGTPGSSGDMPTLNVLVNGRSDLAGPLSQLGLGRSGKFYVVCAGLGYHAGSGGWKEITDGNTHLIGIEAENAGDGSPWPAVQMDAYRRGVAAILQHIGRSADYAIGHKEWTPRKDDPTFDMNQFRRDVATLMAGGTIAPLPDTPENRPVLGKGDSGAWVEKLQKALGVKVDGDFGEDTEAAVRTYQATRGLKVDGLVGRDTWAALMTGAPATQPATTASGKGSWYSQYRGKYVWIDNGDAPGSAALGVPDDAQGIALYDRSTLGSWFAVTAPNGVTSIEQQTDIGPHPNTGRLIDIAAAAAERFGYAPTNFPTDGRFTWRPVPPPSAVASLTPQQQAVKWRDLRKTAAPDPVTPIPQPEPQPMPDAALAQILSALTNLDARMTRLEQAPAPSLPATGGTDWVGIVTSVGGAMQKLPHVVATVDDLMDRVPQIIAAGERVAGLIERFGPSIGLLTGGRTGIASLPAAPPVLIQPPAATSQPPVTPAPSSGPGVGFWPGLLTVIGSAIAALNGVDPHLAASIAVPGVGLIGAAAVKATPKDWTAVRERVAPPKS